MNPLITESTLDCNCIIRRLVTFMLQLLCI